MRQRYLRPSHQFPEIYLYRAPVDCRKQAHGLALIVEQELGHSPFTGALYAFTNRQRNKIKCLMWEDNGFVLYYKALAEERFKWPGPGDELMSLTGEQIGLPARWLRHHAVERPQKTALRGPRVVLFECARALFLLSF